MLTAVATILAGTIAFWVIVSLSFILMVYWLDDEEPHGVLTTLTFIVTVLLLSFVNKGPINSFVHNVHFSNLLIIAAAYIVIGICWSFVKWYSFLLKKKDKFFQLQEEDVKWGRTPRVFKKEDIPLAKDYKSKIILWMSYWPWSALWTLLNDPVRKLFNAIYRKISIMYQRISNNPLS